MTRRRKVAQDIPAVPLNFLLTCSQKHLGEYELKKLADVANIRNELHEVLDRFLEEMAQASLVRWFRTQDRESIKHALENPDDVIAMAKQRIKDGQRSGDELIPRALLPPGSAHLAAALRYQKRNIAEGKCSECPEPLDRNSVRFCTTHLQNARLRYKPKNAKGAKPGSIGWLHGEGFESQHGRQPGTLQSLAISREKKSRAILAELGLPAGSTATALQAAKAALLEHMPRTKHDAMTVWELFDKAGLSGQTEGTAKKALQQLVSAGLVQRIGKGVSGNPFLYFHAGRKASSVFGVSTETLVG